MTYHVSYMFKIVFSGDWGAEREIQGPFTYQSRGVGIISWAAQLHSPPPLYKNTV